MRPGQQNKRGRGRNNNNNNNHNNNNNNHRKGGNPLTRTYDSSGPDVKIRGTAQHIAEKYSALARDAQSAGDRVIAENYLQHAEHYYRIIAAAQAQMQERFPQNDRQDNNDRQDYNDRDGYDRDQDDLDTTSGDDQPVVSMPVEQPVIDQSTPQPVIEGTPAEVAAEQEEGAPAAASGNGRTPSARRRTNAGSRPRRPRRGEGQAEGEGSGGDAPALETSGTE